MSQAIDTVLLLIGPGSPRPPRGRFLKHMGQDAYDKIADRLNEPIAFAHQTNPVVFALQDSIFAKQAFPRPR